MYIKYTNKQLLNKMGYVSIKHIMYFLYIFWAKPQKNYMPLGNEIWSQSIFSLPQRWCVYDVNVRLWCGGGCADASHKKPNNIYWRQLSGENSYKKPQVLFLVFFYAYFIRSDMPSTPTRRKAIVRNSYILHIPRAYTLSFQTMRRTQSHNHGPDTRTGTAHTHTHLLLNGTAP